MKFIIILFIIFAPIKALAVGVGEYSIGYRMGEITKFSIKGIMFKSGEGQMLMGSESTPYSIKSKDGDGKVTTKNINPWQFSSLNTEINNLINENIGEYVYVKYKESYIKSPSVDTPYEIIEINSINPPIDISCISTNYTKGSKSDGTRIGRIVKASSKGLVSKSYEIIMQEGNSGNQFKALSISEDTDLYKCAVNYLMSGQRVKITYNESIINLNILNRETPYDIIKIEPAKGKLN